MTNIHDLTPLAAANLSVDVRAGTQCDGRPRDQDVTVKSVPYRSHLFGPRGRRTELVRAYGELDDVCTQLGFGTELTLGEWSMSPNWAVLILARAARPPLPPPAGDWAAATIPEVIADIVTTHHVPLRHELERLAIIMDHLVIAHPHANLEELHREYHQFKDEITLHIDQEESELFPLCIELEVALYYRGPGGLREITSIIRFSSHGHAENEAGLQRILDQLKIAASNLGDPDIAIIRVGMEAISRDLVIHGAKEGEILFPAAIYSEELLRTRHVRPRFDTNEKK